MLVLDENLPAGQRQLLRKWRIKFRVVGVEIATSGTQDEDLIAALLQLASSTFFSLDRHFYRPDWAHEKYGLVWLDTTENRAAEFIRRFLRHPDFNTQAKRLGMVARIHHDGIFFWRSPRLAAQSVVWPVG